MTTPAADTLPADLTARLPLPCAQDETPACHRTACAEPARLTAALDALAATLAALPDYPTDSDFVDALILAAEAVLDAASLSVAAEPIA